MSEFKDFFDLIDFQPEIPNIKPKWSASIFSKIETVDELIFGYENKLGFKEKYFDLTLCRPGRSKIVNLKDFISNVCNQSEIQLLKFSDENVEFQTNSLIHRWSMNEVFEYLLLLDISTIYFLENTPSQTSDIITFEEMSSEYNYNLLHEVKIEILLALYLSDSCSWCLGFEHRLISLIVKHENIQHHQDFLKAVALNCNEYSSHMIAIEAIENLDDDFLVDVINSPKKEDYEQNYGDILEGKSSPLFLIKDKNKLKLMLDRLSQHSFPMHHLWAAARLIDDPKILKKIIKTSSDEISLIEATKRLFYLGEVDYVREIARNALELTSLGIPSVFYPSYQNNIFSNSDYDVMIDYMISAQGIAMDLLKDDQELLVEIASRVEDPTLSEQAVWNIKTLEGIYKVKNERERRGYKDPWGIVDSAIKSQIKRMPQSIDFIMNA